MRFNLAHIIPTPRLHGLNGYAEVLESIRWGIEQLGHGATVRVNEIVGDEINIIFGFQMLDPDAIARLPENTIIYNLEQMGSVPIEQLRPTTFAAAARLQLWDYSVPNIAAWRALNARFEPRHVPIGWTPTLERVPQNQTQDIDVLFYGLPSDARMQAISKIARACHVTVFACGLYGAARDELIARSRLILNINRFDQMHVFEIVRVSYLLGNGKAVVSDLYPESEIDEDIRDAVAFVPVDQIPAACNHLLSDEPVRRRLEATGRQVMQRRDIREILRKTIQEIA